MYVLLSVPILLCLYAVGIQYERGGWWRVVLPVTVAALMLDVLLNYTVFAVLTWDMPQRGEATFTRRLKRLIQQDDWRSKVAKAIKPVLDYFDPSGVHI